MEAATGEHARRGGAVPADLGQQVPALEQFLNDDQGLPDHGPDDPACPAPGRHPGADLHGGLPRRGHQYADRPVALPGLEPAHSAGGVHGLRALPVPDGALLQHCLLPLPHHRHLLRGDGETVNDLLVQGPGALRSECPP